MERITVKEVDIHICGGGFDSKTCRKACTGKCPYCYVDMVSGSNPVFRDLPVFGDTKTLMQVIRNIHASAQPEDLVFVGGDPCEHDDLMKLIQFAKGLGMNVAVLSNTHIYRDGGKIIPIEWITPFVDELALTLHGIGVNHDSVNGNKGAYEKVIRQLKRFMLARGKSDRAVSIVLNFVPYTMLNIEEMMIGIIEELQMDPERDYFAIQRIAPTGLAEDDYEQWKVRRDLLPQTLEVIERIRKDRGFETKVDTIDVFPWCAIPDKYHYMLHEGGCQWGRPNGILSVVQNGGIQRCALSERTIGSFLDIDTQGKFARFMLDNQTLSAFREHRHLDDKCLHCQYLDKCGGGCVIASGNGDPYVIEGAVHKGHDYLVV